MNEIHSIIGYGKKYTKISITRQHKSNYYTQKITLQLQQQVQLGPYLVLCQETQGTRKPSILNSCIRCIWELEEARNGGICLHAALHKILAQDTTAYIKLSLPLNRFYLMCW